MTCLNVANFIGKRSLFLGTNTNSWTLQQFQDASKFARAHGISSLFVKVADGGNRWYQWSGDNINGWRSIRQTILQNGVGAIPYTYSYGNTYNALNTEIALLQEYMRDAGVVIADMEQEWNGHADWGAELCSAMKAVPGIFLVSTWANPDDQNWQGVIQALNPCVDSYLPQQYTNYLASCWGQFGALGAACIMPTVMIGQDFGPNDPVAIAKAAHVQGHAAMSVWYYDTAVENAGLLDQIVAAFPIQEQNMVSQEQYDHVVQQLTTLQNAWNKVVPEKNQLVADKAALQKRVLDLENAYNAVNAEKNGLVADKANLQKQVADLEAQLKAQTQAAIDQAAADIQTAITSQQNALKALGK